MKTRTILMGALLAMAAGAKADDITVGDMTAPIGQQAEVAVQFQFDEADLYGGFQFVMVLPEGLSAVLNSKGDPQYSLSSSFDNTFTPLSTHDTEAGCEHYGTISMGGSTITGTSGTLCTLLIQAGEGLTVGDELTVQMKDVQLNGTDGMLTTYIPDFTFTVTVAAPADTRVILDETSTTVPSASDGAVDILVRRTIKKDMWNTICLPFAMTEEQVYEVFGDDVQLQEFDSYDAEYDGDDVTSILVHFVDADLSDGFLANNPYMIKTSADITEFEVNSTMEPDEESAVVEYDNGLPGKRRHVYGTFYGTYHAQTTVPESCLFISDNKFWYSTGATKMKAFRGYFELEDVLSDAANANINYTFDGTSGIREVNRERMAEGAVYTIQGQLVGQDIDLKKLPSGIYIVNGKKVVIK